MTDEEAIRRFTPQIEQAAKKAAFNYPSIADDIYSYAYERVMMYARSGRIDKWNGEVNDNQDRLDGWVLRRLNLDLKTFAIRKIGRQQQWIPFDDEINIAPEKDDRGDLAGYPASAIRYRYRDPTSYEEIAAELNVSVMTVRRMLKREQEQFRAGYCPHGRLGGGLCDDCFFEANADPEVTLAAA